MAAEGIDWLKPSPLWSADGQDFRQQDFFRPALLEFRTDNFIEEFLAASGAPEPGALQGAIMRAPTQGPSLKLFQPAHGCFYLVNASLCCREVGFPDRQVRLGDGESVFFVLRKLINGAEHAWVVGAAGSEWSTLDGQPRRLLAGEERLPLFNAATRDCRATFAGYVPVSSSETYKVAAKELAVSPPRDTRIEELGSRFTAGVEQARTIPDTVTIGGQLKPLVDEQGNALSLAVSVYLILDLYEYLVQYLPDVAEALRNNPSASFSGDRKAEKEALMRFLAELALGGSVSLGSALGLVARKQAELDTPGGVRLADPKLGFDANYSFRQHPLSKSQLEELITKVRNALPTEQPPVELPKLTQRSGAAADEYVVRCCYARPECAEVPLVVSLPSARFRLAPFFDPDAPARPVRIPLPSDVSVAGMRKFKKNVSFMMSDAMRKKMASIAGLEQKLLGDDPAVNPDDGLDLGFICSFSIQIIFIVAFFLLLIFAIILNFVFWWMAFFKICFPVPKNVLSE